ncbi:unnamed protein product, partial [Ceratitis capitata]
NKKHKCIESLRKCQDQSERSRQRSATAAEEESNSRRRKLTDAIDKCADSENFHRKQQQHQSL